MVKGTSYSIFSHVTILKALTQNFRELLFFFSADFFTVALGAGYYSLLCKEGSEVPRGSALQGHRVSGHLDVPPEFSEGFTADCPEGIIFL